MLNVRLKSTFPLLTPRDVLIYRVILVRRDHPERKEDKYVYFSTKGDFSDFLLQMDFF